MKTNYRNAIEQWAEANYSKGYGYQVFIECYDDAEYLEIFGHCKTKKEALKLAQELAEAWNELILRRAKLLTDQQRQARR